MLRVLLGLMLFVMAATKESTVKTSLVPFLLKLERAVAVLTTKMEEVESQLQSNTAAICTKVALKKDFKASVMKTDSNMDAFKKDLQDVSKSLAQLQTDVAFEARLPHNMHGVPDRVAIKFTGIVYNKHNGFSSSSGIFTAPVSGTYIIWAHIMSNDKHRLHVLIKHNGKIIGQSHTSGGVAHYEVPSITTVIPLNKGDQVCFEKFGSPNLRGDNWSSYGGALIRAN